MKPMKLSLDLVTAVAAEYVLSRRPQLAERSAATIFCELPKIDTPGVPC
jgi:hypothetical protein